MEEKDFKQEAVIQHFVSLRAEHPEWTAERTAKVALEEVMTLYEVCRSEFNF